MPDFFYPSTLQTMTMHHSGVTEEVGQEGPDRACVELCCVAFGTCIQNLGRKVCACCWCFLLKKYHTVTGSVAEPLLWAVHCAVCEYGLSAAFVHVGGSWQLAGVELGYAVLTSCMAQMGAPVPSHLVPSWVSLSAYSQPHRRILWHRGTELAACRAILAEGS